MLLTDQLKDTLFSPAEQSIVDYMLQNPEAVRDQTIKQLASVTYTHPSTFIRIAKKLGYTGWGDLKRAYLEEWRYLHQHFTEIDANLPFAKGDSVLKIASHIAALEKTAIEDTLALMHHTSLEAAKNILDYASFVRIFGSNANVLISQDFALKMNRIKKTTFVSIIKGESLYEAYSFPPNSCAILISYSGENRDILHLNRILRGQGIPTIALTSIGENTLSKECTCFLPITTREKFYSKIASYTINLSIIYLLDVLYSLVFAERYDENLTHLKKVGQKVDTRKSSLKIMREDDGS